MRRRTARGLAISAAAGGPRLERWGRLTSEKETAPRGDEFVANPKWQLTRAYAENRARATVARQPETQLAATRPNMSAGHHLAIQLSPARAARGGSRPDRLVSRLRPSTAEERFFGACVLILALHLAAVALLFPGDADALPRAALLLCAGLGAPALLALFIARGRVVRGVLAALIGLSTTVTGLATTVPHAVLTGADGADYTGIPATAAGIALVVLAFRIALRGRRLLVKLAFGIPACFVIAQWLIAPAVNAGIATNAPRPVVASARTLGLPGARDVTFPAGDGVRLSGWYVAGRNGAAVILLHGSHGTRVDTLAHLRMLAAAGYAVLAYDARGHGQSSGQTNALGWLGTEDIAGAVAFLQRQPGVDPRQITGLGLSMGAEEALRAAATGVALRAVIADGAGGSTLGDSQLVPHALAPVFVSVTWLTMRATDLVAGESEPAALNTIVDRIRVPVLLIASNAPNERATDQIFRDRIGPSAALWYVAEAGHTKALDIHPQAYAARVRAFLRAALSRP